MINESSRIAEGETASGKVSVIIPTYNHGRFVADAVESVLAQTYANVEVLVIDDGSTDNTRAVLAAYEGRITYIYQQNKGLSAARNAGILASQGEFIAILDADDMWLPEKIDIQMKVFAKDPAVGLVSCGDVLVDILGNPMAPGVEKSEKIVRFKDLILGNCVSGGSSAVIKRSCFDVVGLFDENLRAAEDWDMWLRIAVRYGVRFTPKVLVKIRVSADSMSAPKNADKMLGNELRVLRKLFSNPTLPVNTCDRGKAFSSRYIAAARAFHTVGNAREARLALKRAILSNPVYFMRQKKHWAMMACIMASSWRR